MPVRELIVTSNPACSGVNFFDLFVVPDIVRETGFKFLDSVDHFTELSKVMHVLNLMMFDSSGDTNGGTEDEWSLV